ncbi:DNRLRE domain-containing protein [Haloferula sargassicola]|uniref:DNRLRE domain-containing protein n=1 Tax=Haloferula sargassicola TaxID=490096 RepID=UPI0033654C01
MPGDADADALSDSWEITYFGAIDLESGWGDPDGDLYSNEENYFGSIDAYDGNDDPDQDYATNEEEENNFDIAGYETSPIVRADSPDNDGVDNLGDGLGDAWEIFSFGDTSTTDDPGERDGTDPSSDTSFADPGILTTAVGNGADTMLTSDTQNATYNPTVAHGDARTLEARNNTDARQRITLLRFDVSALQGDMTHLTLRMSCNAALATRSLPIYALIDGAPGEDWDEATTAYLTAPGLLRGEIHQINQFARDPSTLVQVGTLDIVAGRGGIYYSRPFTSHLQSVLNKDSDGVVTLAIAGVDNNQLQFDSKERAADLAEPALAPALVAPLGSVVLPVTSDPVVIDLTLDTAADPDTLTLDLGGLAASQSYHVESAGNLGDFAAIPGSTFDAAGTTDSVTLEVDATANPKAFFRVVEGAEP